MKKKKSYHLHFHNELSLCIDTYLGSYGWENGSEIKLLPTITVCFVFFVFEWGGKHENYKNNNM